MNEFGKRLVAAREAKGWSKYRLAKATGLSEEGIAKLEREGNPRLDTLVRVAQELGVTVASLTGEDTPTKVEQPEPSAAAKNPAWTKGMQTRLKNAEDAARGFEMLNRGAEAKCDELRQEVRQLREKLARLKRFEHEAEMDDLFAVLGGRVSKNIITRWFSELAKRYHPDRGGSDDAMRVINDARDTLVRLLK